MTLTLTRAQFIRGEFRAPSASAGARVRPPWALPEALFTQLCTGCGECVAECSHFLLQPGRDRLPVLDFERGGCNFCGDCVEACAHGALSRLFQGEPNPPWTYKAQILGDCLSGDGVLCRLCGEDCETLAIRFRPEIGGRTRPVIDADACTGCGECYRRCPPRALGLRPAVAA